MSSASAESRHLLKNQTWIAMVIAIANSQRMILAIGSQTIGSMSKLNTVSPLPRRHHPNQHRQNQHQHAKNRPQRGRVVSEIVIDSHGDMSRMFSAIRSSTYANVTTIPRTVKTLISSSTHDTYAAFFSDMASAGGVSSGLSSSNP